MTNSKKTTHFCNELGNKLTKLQQERETWETTVFDQSNTKLYEILAGCYRCLLSCYDSEDKSDESKVKTIKEILRKREVKFQKNSTIAGLIVKAVFGPERRRTNQYGTVLIAAKRAGKKANEFATWVREQGGVEEVRLEASGSERKSAEDFIAIAKEVYANAEAIRANPFNMPEADDTYEGFVVALARPNVGKNAGTAVIVEFLDADAIKPVLVKLGQFYNKNPKLRTKKVEAQKALAASRERKQVQQEAVAAMSEAA